MALLSYALVGLNDAKSFLDYTGSDSDMELLINAVTEYIEGRTGRRFVSTTYTQEEFDGSGNEQVCMNQYPIVAWTSLEKRNSFDNTDDWDTINADEYWRDDSAGIITKTTIFSKGKNNYRATYQAGFVTIPYDLQFLTMSLIDHFIKLKKGSGIKSESLGDHTITFEGILQINPNLMEILKRYKKITVAD